MDEEVVAMGCDASKGNFQANCWREKRALMDRWTDLRVRSKSLLFAQALVPRTRMGEEVKCGCPKLAASRMILEPKTEGGWDVDARCWSERCQGFACWSALSAFRSKVILTTPSPRWQPQGADEMQPTKT
jgi:hypothetical protein